MVMAREVAPLRRPSVAAMVYLVAYLLIERLLKMATPLLAATVTPPPRVPPPGLLLRARVTLEVSLLTRLLNVSSTCTVTAGLMAWPAVALDGCWLKAR